MNRRRRTFVILDEADALQVIERILLAVIAIHRGRAQGLVKGQVVGEGTLYPSATQRPFLLDVERLRQRRTCAWYRSKTPWPCRCGGSLPITTASLTDGGKWQAEIDRCHKPILVRGWPTTDLGSSKVGRLYQYRGSS